MVSQTRNDIVNSLTHFKFSLTNFLYCSGKDRQHFQEGFDKAQTVNERSELTSLAAWKTSARYGSPTYQKVLTMRRTPMPANTMFAGETPVR